MRQAGFDPQGMAAMFRRLMNASRLNEGMGGGYASTHPLSIQRLSDIENRIDRQPHGAVRSEAEFWFIRTRLALIQARDHADRQRLQQTLRSEARDLQGARQAAALYGLAVMEKSAGDLNEAAALMRQAQAIQPAPQLDMLAIELAAAQQGAAAAESVSAAAWKRWPQNQGVAAARAHALQMAGRDADAVTLLQAAAAQWPQTPEFQKLLATSLQRQGREVEAHEALATYFEQTGALPTAVEHLQQARKLTQDFYAQSRLDTRIRAVRDRLEEQRILLEPFKN